MCVANEVTGSKSDGLSGRPPGADKAGSQSCTSGRARDGCCVMRSEPPLDRSDLCGRAGEACVTSPCEQLFSHTGFFCPVTQTQTCTQTPVQTFTPSDKQGIVSCLLGVFIFHVFSLSAGNRHLIPPIYHRGMETSVGECVCVCVSVGLQLCVCLSITASIW